VVTASGGILLFLGLIGGSGKVASAAAKAVPDNAPQSASAHDVSVHQALQDATHLAASVLASARSIEEARSALVAAQKKTGCAPEEGGPSFVHIGNDAQKAAELAARADFYATAHENGRQYATHAQVRANRMTVVHVAVAWACSPAT
jgi:hypothetical protein